MGRHDAVTSVRAKLDWLKRQDTRGLDDWNSSVTPVGRATLERLYLLAMQDGLFSKKTYRKDAMGTIRRLVTILRQMEGYNAAQHTETGSHVRTAGRQEALSDLCTDRRYGSGR